MSSDECSDASSDCSDVFGGILVPKARAQHAAGGVFQNGGQRTCD